MTFGGRAGDERPRMAATSRIGRPRLCSGEMLCDLVCFVVIGILACYFLQYLIALILDQE